VLTVGDVPAPPIPVPDSGSFAVATLADGVLASHDAARPRPIGSVAKTLTALVVLQQRPLEPGADGPVLTMTAADVALYEQTRAEGGSFVPVTAGEQLTERQVLLALMLPSANNIAETLARWVSGTREAFIALLNQQARALGMTDTHLADPSGFSPLTVSTAQDLVRLAEAALRDQAFRRIVATRQEKLPDGTMVTNLDILLGIEPGWIGIKTGWTPQAGGCLLFAAEAAPAGEPGEVTAVGAALGQPPSSAGDAKHPELGGAFIAAARATRAALAGYVAVTAVSLHPSISGDVVTRWGDAAGVQLAAIDQPPVIARLGTVVHLTMSPTGQASGGRGTPVARVAALGPREVPVARWQVVLAAPIQPPGFWWRLWNA
jgi:D-alanyl-D-alanine carboxypeptidase (penicillin-binding protein 5/6)